MSQPTRLFDFPRYQLANRPLDLMMTMPNNGNRVSYSTEQFVEAVDRTARGLIAMGLNAGDKVALVSHNNRCEWNIMDHAIMSVGAINCPLYPTMTEADYEYILNHSESRYCAVSNQELYDKVMSIRTKFLHWNTYSCSSTATATTGLPSPRRAATPSRPNSMPAWQRSSPKIWRPSFTHRVPRAHPRGSCSATTTSPRP